MDDDITGQLRAARAGGRDEFDRLFELVYPRLKRMARRRLRGRGDAPTLDTTGLVHEAYLKLVDQTRADWADRRHFFAVAAQVLRHLVVDHVRHRQAARRGGGHVVPLDEEPVANHPAAEQVLDVDAALGRLAAVDPRLAEVVEMRFFAGLSVEETGEILGISPRTVKRDWKNARALLLCFMRSEAPRGGAS